MSYVKSFVDGHQGNVFIKDIKDHLWRTGRVHVPEATLGYWLKHNLGYTYKKAVTTSPDIKKVEFVQHQAYVAEKVKEAIAFGLYFIFVDETAFTRNEGKAYGFAPKGERLAFHS